LNGPLQSSLVDWIVIDNPKSKLDFGFGLSIQFLHFNPNPKAIIFLIKKPKTPAIKPSYFLSTFVLQLISWLIKICLLGIPCLKHLCKILLMFAAFHFFSSSWIVIGFGLDCQSIL
jgi:hypothetical protein